MQVRDGGDAVWTPCRVLAGRPSSTDIVLSSSLSTFRSDTSQLRSSSVFEITKGADRPPLLVSRTNYSLMSV